MPYSGLATINENGPETLILPGGTRVIPYGAGGGAPSAGGYADGQPIVVNLMVDGQRLAQATVKHMPHAVRTATGRRNI